MSKREPHWRLERVKSLAAQKDGLFIMKERAMDLLAHICPTRTDAYLFVRGVICDTLSEDHFAETVQLATDLADVYGLYIGEDPWYIKITIDEDQPEVVVISFHAPAAPLRTRSAIVQPKKLVRPTR